MSKQSIDPPDAALGADELALVAEIAAAGSLTVAARNARLTQPALSRRLQRVEQRLGITLFERGLRGVKPTDYALTLLPRARTIQTQLAQAVQELEQLRGKREGHVTIALSHLATIALLPAVLDRFRRDWPNVLVRIEAPVFPDRFAGLREGRPDFAVVPRPVEPMPSDLVARLLHSTTVVAIAHRRHPLAQARNLSQLVGAEWVLPGMSSTSAKTLQLAFRRAKLSSPRIAVFCETLTGLEVLVAESGLLGLVPLEIQRRRAPASGLVELPLDTRIEGPSLALIRWREARPTPATARLAELFVQVAVERLTYKKQLRL